MFEFRDCGRAVSPGVGAQYLLYSLQNDAEVEPERPVVDVLAIELHDITKRIAALEARDKRDETR